MVLVGRKWVIDDRNFGGVIDDVRWWEGERTEAQLQEYMHRPVPDNEPKLIKNWGFNYQDGDSVAGSYYRGGGNDFNAPSWIPSPVTSHGGSVAISMRTASSPIDVPVCAILTPEEPGAIVTFSLTGTSSLGSLTPSSSAMAIVLEGTPLGSTRFCTNVTFEPWTSGSEEVAFEVVALLADGVTELASTQNISIKISGNTPPTAGAASAVVTDLQTGLRNLQRCRPVVLAPDFNEVSIGKLMESLASNETPERLVTSSGSSTKSPRMSVVRSAASNLTSLRALGSSASGGGGTHVICVDCAQIEALAAGHILLKMLRPLFSNHGNLYILRTDQPRPWSKSTQAAIVLCTSGCFGSARFLLGLLLLVQRQIHSVLPVVATNNFVFPSGSFYEDMEARVAQLCVDSGAPQTRSLLSPFTRALFQKITSRFSVHDSLTILETQATLISRRLMDNIALLTDYTREDDSAVNEILTEVLGSNDDNEQAARRDLALETKSSYCSDHLSSSMLMHEDRTDSVNLDSDEATCSSKPLSTKFSEGEVRDHAVGFRRDLIEHVVM